MGPRAGLDGGKPRPTGIRSPDHLARSSVAIPTELPGPPNTEVTALITLIVTSAEFSPFSALLRDRICLLSPLTKQLTK